jgi:hypothetical protein
MPVKIAGRKIGDKIQFQVQLKVEKESRYPGKIKLQVEGLSWRV